MSWSRAFVRLSEEQRQLVGEAGARELVGEAELRERVHAYLGGLEGAAREHEFMDVATGRELGERCLRLLDRVASSQSEDERRAVQAAVLYYVLDEDAESDTGSPIGFDDDREVVAAAERYLGL